MMEFDEIVVKESPGLCRCCLSEGCYKDLGSEYTWMNETEVYADMLLECFDISITQHNEGPNGPNRLICEVCITRLRDACNFKKQVMDSEKKFIDMMGRGEFRPKMLIYQTQLKCEVGPPVEEHIDDEGIQYLEDDVDFGDDDLKDELTQPSVSDVTVSTLPIKGKRGRPRKNTPVKPEKRSKVSKIEDKAKTPKAVAKDSREELRRLFTIFLGHSTIMPFKWYLNRYRCYYCDETFIDCSKLKEHTKKHDEVKISRILKRIGCHSRIKWDISEISCKLCPKPIVSIDHYLNHLSEAHDLDINKDVFHKYCYIFKLSDEGMICLECCESFKFFGPLLRHINKFHNSTKKYVCDYCGLAFALKGTIKQHIRNRHSGMKTKCKFCDKIFRTKVHLANHCRKQHKTGKFVCDLCPKTFESRYFKRCHMALDHNVKVSDETIEARHAERQRKDDLTKLMTIIIENSSILPFRWSASKYMCFYCCCDFVDSAKLKEHTIEEHKGAKLKNVLRTFIGSSRVKLDTSEITCNKCYQEFRLFDEFLTHLAAAHQFKINKEIAKCIFTFNLSDDGMSCHDCGQEFRFFGPLLKHAHKFHNKYKTFLCEICGQGFVAKANVLSHIKNVHTFTPGLHCRRCDKVFRNHYSLQTHCESVHRTEMLKCPKCPEMLASQYLKKRHLALVHDVKKLQFNCDQCERVFTMKSRLVQHKLRTHLKQKTISCDVCGFKVFSSDLLKRHMVRHDNSRPFECKFCQKTFQRKKTLDVHTRIHTNDKRYACKECGRAFVQVTSWKLHMRVHHGGTAGASWH